MRRRVGRVSLKQLDELSGMEALFQATLRPVAPRAEFVNDLRERLELASLAKKSSINLLRFALFGLAGIISSMILVIAGLRAALTILGTLGILRQSRGQLRQKITVPAQTTL